MNVSTRVFNSGVSLLAASSVFLAFWLLTILVETPDSIWAITLSMHALVFLCFAVGLGLMGRRLTTTGWQRIAWWIGAVVLIAGTVAGWLVFAAGILVLAVFEMILRNRIAGATLVAGFIPLVVVYLRGVHYGDENSRSATSVEEMLAVVGVTLVAFGVAAIGVDQLKRQEQFVSSG